MIIFCCSFLLLGGIFTLASRSFLNDWENKKKWIKTSGKIIDMKKSHIYFSEPGVYTVFPLYEFYVNGEFKRVSSNIGESSVDKFQIGQEVEVFYNPNNLNQSYIGIQMKKSITRIKVFRIIGISFLGISIILFL